MRKEEERMAREKVEWETTWRERYEWWGVRCLERQRCEEPQNGKAALVCVHFLHSASSAPPKSPSPTCQHLPWTGIDSLHPFHPIYDIRAIRTGVPLGMSSSFVRSDVSDNHIGLVRRLAICRDHSLTLLSHATCLNELLAE